MLRPIDLPPGNEIHDFTPVAEYETAKEAQAAAHKMCHDFRFSVAWQEFKDDIRILGYAVYVMTNQLQQMDIGGEG